MTEYIIITGNLNDIGYFESECTSKLDAGWKPVGGIAYSDGVIVQAFWIYISNKENKEEK